MHIKTTVRYHLTLVIMTIVEKTDKVWQECGKKGTFVHCW